MFSFFWDKIRGDEEREIEKISKLRKLRGKYRAMEGYLRKLKQKMTMPKYLVNELISRTRFLEFFSHKISQKMSKHTGIIKSNFNRSFARTLLMLLDRLKTTFSNWAYPGMGFFGPLILATGTWTKKWLLLPGSSGLNCRRHPQVVLPTEKLPVWAWTFHGHFLAKLNLSCSWWRQNISMEQHFC